jgi:hypothetical protein
MMLGVFPIATVPIGGIDAVPTGLAGPAPVYFSDRGWTGEPDDTLWPNRHFAPRVEQGLSLSRAIPISPLDGNRVVPVSGSLSLHNTDGELDSMVSSMAIDGRDVEVRVGHPLYDGSQFETIFKGTTSGWKLADRDRIELDLRDFIWQIDRPIQTNLYLGTGGIEGGADLAGVPKPLCFGRLFNVPLTLIDPANLIYQVHDGKLGQVLGCYVMGEPLGDAGDVADITLAAPGAGQFCTQLNGGYIKLGSTPDGLPTADVIGDEEWGIAPLTTADIIYRILRHRLGLADGYMESLSFLMLKIAWPGEVGFYVAPQATGAVSVINRLLQPILGFMVQGRSGRLRVGTLALPADGEVRARLDINDIVDIGRSAQPDSINPPYWRVSATWGRNWSPMAPEDISGQIIDTQPARYAFLTGAGRIAFWEDPTVIIRHPAAQDVMIDSLFAYAADAVDLATRVGAIYSEARALVKVSTMLQGYLLEENDVVTLDHPRYDLAGGRSVVVVGIEFDLQGRASSLDLMW